MVKAGGPGRSVWQQIRGDNYVFHIVEDIEKWADLDTPAERGMSEAELALWGRDLRKCLQSRQIITYRTYNDLDIKSDEGKQPNLLSIRYVTVKPGQGRAYLTWLREGMVPGYRKVGSTGHSWGKVIMGGDLNQYYHAFRLDSFADLDKQGPLSAGLSREELSELLGENYNNMLVDSKRVLLRYRADLSYKSPHE